MEENNQNHDLNSNNNHDLNQNDDDHDYTEEERSGVGGSRWNPTKEQIEMLEKVYSSEGVRTPSAEQIQQITARLRVYGHIEGKNVFYWFQNHKARQRQKQRLERLSAAAAAANASANHSFSRVSHFLGPSPYHHYHPNHGVGGGVSGGPRPIFPAIPPAAYHHHYLPNPNVICSQYYHHVPQQSNLGYYNPPQHHYSAPATPDHNQTVMKRSSKSSINKSSDGQRVGVPHGSTLSGYCTAMMKSKSVDQGNCMGMKTLNLFPVHPTGILEHKNDDSSANNSAANSCATSSSSDHTFMNDYGYGDVQNPHFIDFFSSGHASSESG